ncbi:MAG: hypothetical protein NTV86_00880 [Planctomycetota bacterium]|nr:hypothetical protein [Planctomycetota bacterium]
MASKLDRLIESLHPTRTFDEVRRRADDALNTFNVGASQMENWDRFRHCLIQFLHHAEIRLLRLSRSCPMGLDFDWGRCCHILMRVYGPNGEKAAFEMARTGNEGGLYAVLRTMAQTMADNYAQDEIEAKVNTYWSYLSVDEKLAAGDEYLAKYGKLLPSELTEGSAARVRANLPKVLEEHPKIIRRLTSVGRT